MTSLIPRPDSPLRKTVRRTVPFGLRIAARRAPHVLRWLKDRPSLQRRSIGGTLLTARSSPLRRPGTSYAHDLQHAKEVNVRRVAHALHGLYLPPGALFSWHATVGPPLQVRGFAAGPELHDGQLARGAGGGACQVANLAFWLGATGGLTLVERHRHGLDLFPDDRRTVPFGCGATVFYPHRDLRFRNPHDVGLVWSFDVDDTHVHGRLFADGPSPGTWTLEERDHRFVRRDGAIWRSNRIVRRPTGNPGGTVEHFVDNLARVTYTLPEDQLTAEP